MVRAGATYLFDAPLDTGLLLDHIQSLRDAGRSEPFRVLLVDDSRDMLAYHSALLANNNSSNRGQTTFSTILR